MGIRRRHFALKSIMSLLILAIICSLFFTVQRLRQTIADIVRTNYTANQIVADRLAAQHTSSAPTAIQPGSILINSLGSELRSTIESTRDQTLIINTQIDKTTQQLSQLATEITAQTPSTISASASATIDLDKIGLRISTSLLADEAVTASKIMDGVVSLGHLAPDVLNSLSTIAINDGSVTTAKLADGAVTTLKIATGAVTGTELLDGSVAAADIANGAIGSLQISNSGVGVAQLADGAVNSNKITDGSIIGDDISANTITTTNIASSAITATQLNADAVTSAKILNGTIATGDITSGAITSALIQDGTIDTTDIAASAITTATIAASAITSGLIADGTIAAGDIANGAITATQIADGAITSNKILDGTIATGDIATNAITNSLLANNTIQAGKLTTASNKKTVSVQIGDTVSLLSDLERAIFIAPTNGTITKVTFTNGANIALGINKGTLSVERKTAATATVASTNLTAVSLTAFSPNSPTLSGGTSFSTGDVYSFKYSAGIVGVSLSGFLVTIEYTASE